MRPRDLEWSDVGPWPSINEEPPRPTPSPPPCSRPADEPNDSKPATAKDDT